MQRAVLTLLLFVFGSISVAQEVEIKRLTLPAEVRHEIAIPATDPSIEGLQWNRWTSKNFVVCSIDDGQAQLLVNNLEHVKTWIYTRWGFDDIQFTTECRLICVNDPALFKKFFKLESSRTEVRMENGKPKLYVVFFLLDDKPSKVIPGPLTEICLANFNETYGIKLPQWCISGMRGLNGDIPGIRQELVELELHLQKNDPMFFSKALLTMKQEEYQSLSPDQKRLYDQNAIAFMLMLRKEFGELALHHFIKQTATDAEPQSALKSIYKFETYEKFDESLKSYMTKLVSDIKQNKTPDSYLQITAEKKTVSQSDR